MKKTIMMAMIIGFVACTKQEKEVARISTRFGDIVVEFFEDAAPKHVESFILLAKQGYFNETTFHRVIPGFVIQGGDPNTKDEDRTNDGSGGHAGKYYGLGEEKDPATWFLPAEFNNISHNRGIVSMARDRAPDTGGSQFFICVNDVPRLDNQYTVFGKVIQGLETIDQIVNVPRDERDNPREPVTMTVMIGPLSQFVD